MNQKKAKQLRKQLRWSGLDPREARYEYVERAGTKGNPFRQQIRLVKDCGRGVYRAMKKRGGYL